MDGTGFENEHIGQIQIPVDTGRGDVGLMSGVPFLGVDEAEGPPGEPDEMVGFRCNVIFGEDLRKPACWKISIYIYIYIATVTNGDDRRRTRSDQHLSGLPRPNIYVGRHCRHNKRGAR